MRYDTRDNLFESHSGWFGSLTLDRHGRFLSSDFAYTRLAFDLRKYLTLTAKDHLAFNFYSETIHGVAPFITLALLGGNKRMRGLYEGRYRDNTSAILQAEYRRKIIGRLGAVVFGGVGVVGEEYRTLQINYLRNTYGGGLRFTINKSDRINIRFDIGVGDGEAAYYLTIGEAF